MAPTRAMRHRVEVVTAIRRRSKARKKLISIATKASARASLRTSRARNAHPTGTATATLTSAAQKARADAFYARTRERVAAKYARTAAERKQERLKKAHA